MNLSVHDNLLLSYSVNARLKEIRLHTSTYPYDDPQEYVDVLFSGVVAYHFECDNFNNILFGVEEVSLEAIYDQYSEMFERLRKHGWPLLSCDTKEIMLQNLHQQEIKAYEISASLGLTGWVWARSCTRSRTNAT